jgi:cyclic pyranopterin phosphate synthase
VERPYTTRDETSPAADCVPAVRRLRTLRISVGSECDLNCVYCDRPASAGSDAGLSASAIVRLAVAAGRAGAMTVRLTGGEPLLRADIESILERIAASDPQLALVLTTNAQRLQARARDLTRAGLSRVNIGLPTLVPETYARMTGAPLGPALEGLEAALDAGLSPVKINAVVVRGLNDGELHHLVDLARSRPVEVRFLEKMPFRGRDSLVPASEIRAALRRLAGTESLGPRECTPTAEVYRPQGFVGRIGIIAPVTEPFCARCDRLRVSSAGQVRSCLSEPGGTDVGPLLTAGAGVDELAAFLLEEFGRKPQLHSGSFCGPMRTIGG